ncbi:putative nitric oxide synthase-interacting protein [Cavenderia fasciculata]|uniref:Nitric oxide synthase-interacting protein n=1 Tax=Cavenderia fasciculata TaxID=261658 RepID=F4QFT5_CACFS|nr:putative nitric oxide synthase-interacting protein [Cavenderia fasciculata]EGG14332.1 putative nitric oxide synthase-interacting protein [Cavenderia fasciculata]|eukprot:XP_004351041.1 putative nitric oxide synthase-interacting protein [Cavenderia fasciculata]
MPRHSKNPASKGQFTYHERQQLEYGTSKVRLGKDSIKDFDSCSICLASFVTPQCCPKGHIYCKECILTSLLKQKKANKEKEKQWDQQQVKIKQQEQEKKLQEEDSKLKEFESNNVTFLENEKTSSTSTTNTNTNNNHLDKDGKPNPFWVSSLIPSPLKQVKTIDKPTMNTVCPEGNHPLLSKQLITLKFKSISNQKSNNNKNNEDNDDEEDVDNGNGYCCPICEKTLTNIHKLKALKTCGHVFCSPCLEKLNETNKKQTPLETKQCLTCQKDYDSDQVISLNTALNILKAEDQCSDAGGGHELIAKKYSPTAMI